jgi:uncharacterized protein YqgV (UPF0045/DUF77 family)
MSDTFVDVILSALDKVDTSTVSLKTDDVSTFIQGNAVALFDVTQAIFLHAAKTGYHIAMTGTFSIGCPGKEDHHGTDMGHIPLNRQNTQHMTQQAGCKVAIYPMGCENYLDVIQDQIDLLKQQNVKVSPDHYATRLDGDVQDVFDAMQELFINVRKSVSRLSMAFTISANSPSTKEGELR